MTRGIQYVSLAEQSGYAEAGRGYLHALHDAGVPLCWTPVAWFGKGYELLRFARPLAAQLFLCPDGRFDLRQLIDRHVDCDTAIVHTIPELWPRFMRSDRRMVGMTVWETTQLPPHWPALFERMDRLMVPCEFNRRILMNEGITRPVAVIPHTLPPLPPPRTAEEMEAFCQREQIEAHRYVFYTIGGWWARKALWNTVRAYLRAFTSRDPVLLVVKTSSFGAKHYSARRSEPTEDICREIVSEFPDPAPVRCISRSLRDGEIQCLHQRGDCYFSMTHSEGWGMGAFEAAALGKPVIITGWGGQLDYLPQAASFLLDFKLIAVEDWMGRGSYISSQQWAQPDMDQAIACLRWVQAHPQEAREKAAPLVGYIQQRFNPAAVAKKILEAIEG